MQVGRARSSSRTRTCTLYLVRVACWGRGHDDIKLSDFEIKYHTETKHELGDGGRPLKRAAVSGHLSLRNAVKFIRQQRATVRLREF